MSEWHKLDEYLDHKGVPHGAPTLCGTDGPRSQCPEHSEHSWHYQGWSRDYGDKSNDCRLLVTTFWPLWNKGLLLELYYAPTKTWLPSNVGGHTDHLHVTIKPGAVLIPPGDDMPLNADDLSKITTIVQQQIVAACTPPNGRVFGLMADFYNNQFAPILNAIKNKVGA